MQGVIGGLSHFAVDWDLITAANHGYWQDVARLTVVKARPSSSKSHFIHAMKDIASVLEGERFEIEITRCDRMWGLFSRHSPCHPPTEPATLGWPFT